MEHDDESSLIADERHLRTANWSLRLAGLLLFAGFGVAWAFGLVWLFSVQAGWAGFWMGVLGFTPFGCVVLWKALKRVVTYIRFGQGTGQIAPADLSEGIPFLFTYQKPVYLPTTVDLTASLVLRERVLSRGGQEHVPPYRDHLVRSCRESRLRCAGGSILGTQCRFEIPAAGTAEFVTAGGLLTWVVKVHIELKVGMDVWEYFELPVSAGRRLPVAPKLLLPGSDYQVIVNLPAVGENYLKAMPAIRGFLPHLDDEQASEFLNTRL